jgi:hypothetical protein
MRKNLEKTTDLSVVSHSLSHNVVSITSQIIYTVINNYQGRNCGFETEEAVENWDLTAQNNAL